MNDFDVEQWRKENPVDYIKGINIINEMSDPLAVNYTFQSLYGGYRLYTPDILYKFYSLNEDNNLNLIKLKTLDEGKVFMSNPSDFNDPFDEEAIYYDQKKLSTIERLKSANGKIFDNFSSFWKATSLSANDYNTMPMWAHYANNHQGFCVAYDMKDEKNIDLTRCTFPIQYVSKKIDITNQLYEFSQELGKLIDYNIEKNIKEIVIPNLKIPYMLSLLGNIKHESWSYEKEFRCSTAANEKNSSYVVAFPKEIYIGLKCKNEMEILLIQIAKKYNIPIYKMTNSKNDSSFSLNTKKIEY